MSRYSAATMITLYHLAISHYNEKARWALDLKEVPHRRRAMVPGLHRLTAWRIAGRTTLPALVDPEAGVRVGESSGILQYLDALVPEPRLYPEQPGPRARVMQIENYFDQQVGTAVRGFSYGCLADRRSLLYERWALGLSDRQRLALRLSMPLVQVALRRVFQLSPDNTLRQRERVLRACDRVEQRLAATGGSYLVGDRFSAADLTGASLLGPLLRPPGSPWAPLAGRSPDLSPPLLQQTREELSGRPVGRWVLQLWKRHR